MTKSKVKNDLINNALFYYLKKNDSIRTVYFKFGLDNYIELNTLKNRWNKFKKKNNLPLNYNIFRFRKC